MWLGAMGVLVSGSVVANVTVRITNGYRLEVV
jgi:hypothetical protein